MSSSDITLHESIPGYEEISEHVRALATNASHTETRLQVFDNDAGREIFRVWLNVLSAIEMNDRHLRDITLRIDDMQIGRAHV